ncbi:MAG: hypothetical protein HXY50_00190 [Ignavibacteriaceae bacterium]|nr:hypothetical protein [Ignavibacteriaceae bacterium]
MQKNKFKLKYFNLLLIASIIVLSDAVFPQYAIKWMSAGSLHNWYSEIGSEIEEGFVLQQQYGLQWPAIYANQDIQCAKALWIGCTNFSSPIDPQSPYNVKVVHVGPRVSGSGEFFPQEFKMISKFEAPIVSVDGEISVDKSVDIDEVDPNLFTDRLIYNKVNTQLGITMTRRIFQFSQEYHDNYIVSEYTFKNTGIVDGGVTLPPTTLTGVYFYFQYRLSVSKNTRYVIGNATGWGINAMLDVRGDGIKVDPPNENFRAQYVWHGKYPPFVKYDNIGGPIWEYPGDGLYVEKGDTVGRLGAYHFAGVVTLHADASATDKNDDPNQPSTTSYEGSDEPNTSQNDSYNKAKMESEYGWMTRGHNLRHAEVVEPTGLPGFLSPTKDPALGTPGGFSNANGYGPYTLAPGDSIVIVVAEAVSGISRELATTVGAQYKNGQISALQKNTVVFQGRDSLFQSFRRAIANYQSGYNIPLPPLPPKIFNVDGLGDRIALSWETFDNPGSNLEGFEIYRAVGKPDSTYTLIHTAGPNDRSYDDATAIRGLNYFYYIVSVGSAASNTGVGLTPPGKLRSSRYYTQTYDGAVLKRPAGDSPYAAKLKGTQPGPFKITAGVNDKLRIRIDNGSAVDISIPAGDSVKTSNVIAKINLDLGLNVAFDNGFGYIWFTSPTVGADSKIEILDISENAYSTLGLTTGLVTGGKPTIQEAMDNIRVVPNPYNISAAKELGFGDLAQNRLYFFNIPGRCNIKIYSELGELIDTIEHTNGSGDEAWDSLTSSGQIVVSGIYIAVIEDLVNGVNKIVKFVIIR